MNPSLPIFAIDPGTTESGVVMYHPLSEQVIQAWPCVENMKVRAMLIQCQRPKRVIVEWIACYGMAVGREVFETCRFVGRLEEIVESSGGEIEYITRPTVKTRICGTPRAKDPNVRQALIDRFGIVGTAKKPGPLYGISKHAWSALAAAVAIDLQ